VLLEEWSASLAFHCYCFGSTSAIALAGHPLMLPIAHSPTGRSLLAVVDRIILPQYLCTATNLRRTKPLGKSQRYIVDWPSHPKSLYTAIPNLTCTPPTTPPSTGTREDIVGPLHSRSNPSRHLIHNLSISVVSSCVSFPIVVSLAVIISSPWAMVITDTPGPFLLFPPFLRSDRVSPLPIINGADV